MTRRSTRKTSSRDGFHKMSCTGCGRHAKLVDSGVVAYFCNHCFTINGNYLRYTKGQAMVKPLEGIRVKDILLGVDGKHYKVVGREDVSGEDKYFYCQLVGDKKKEVIILGDFFFVEKVSA